MTTNITNPETPIVHTGPEFGSGEMASQSDEFVSVRPELGLGEKTSRNEHDSVKERAINKPTPFDGDRKKTETFLQECRVYLLSYTVFSRTFSIVLRLSHDIPACSQPFTSKH